MGKQLQKKVGILHPSHPNMPGRFSRGLWSGG
ncbi:hypothetical protein Nmel_017667, partial [Mimus melanotis]